jgi:hypothetical protein
MKGFYDQMIPSFLNKFGKKYGAKVEDTKIDTGKNNGEFTVKGFQDWFFEQNPNMDTIPNDIYDKAVSEYKKTLGGEEKVHSLEITPALKDAALYEGFTLFQKESDLARGQIRIGNTKLNIDIFKDANESTLFHESGHAFLENMKDDFKFISELDQTN